MTLNEAIYKVIKTQFKKDMGGALAIVEQAGYKVTKWDGRFYVKNPRNNKELCLRTGYKGYVVSGNGYDKCKFSWDGICRMDLVGYLEKPFNREWYKVQAMRCDWKSPTIYKWERLRNAVYLVDCSVRGIEETKRKIAELTSALEHGATRLAERKQNLATIRKELGLIK